MEFGFSAQLWMWDGPGAWYFVTVPRAISAEIRREYSERAKPGGSLRVGARIGATRWKSSLFYDTKRVAYLLPVKAAVRAKEQLRDRDMVKVNLVMEVA
jgi:hypothetical protein